MFYVCGFFHSMCCKYNTQGRLKRTGPCVQFNGFKDTTIIIFKCSHIAFIWKLCIFVYITAWKYNAYMWVCVCLCQKHNSKTSSRSAAVQYISVDTCMPNLIHTQYSLRNTQINITYFIYVLNRLPAWHFNPALTGN